MIHGLKEEANIFKLFRNLSVIALNYDVSLKIESF